MIKFIYDNLDKHDPHSCKDRYKNDVINANANGTHSPSSSLYDLSVNWNILNNLLANNNKENN